MRRNKKAQTKEILLGESRDGSYIITFNQTISLPTTLYRNSNGKYQVSFSFFTFLIRPVSYDISFVQSITKEKLGILTVRYRRQKPLGNDKFETFGCASFDIHNLSITESFLDFQVNHQQLSLSKCPVEGTILRVFVTSKFLRESVCYYNYYFF